MKAVILCGGMGTRLRDVSELIPKPMVPIGTEPILWHIMKYYSRFGIEDFVLCLGYKKEALIDYFLNYPLRNSDLVVDTASQEKTVHAHDTLERWRVTLSDTGLKTMTGSRLKRVSRYLNKNEPFMLTYGDGLANVNLDLCLKSHKASGRLATVTAVHPTGRFGEIELKGSEVLSFAEKPQTTQGYINGGFMIFQPEFIERYIHDDENCILEADSLAEAAHEGQLNAYCHDGFWQCMDNAREYHILNELWQKGAPWKIW